MTVAVGLRTDDGVWLGADSCSADDYKVIQVDEPKLFRVGMDGESEAPAFAIAGAWPIVDVLKSMRPLPALGSRDVGEWAHHLFRLGLVDAVDASLGSVVAEKRWEQVKDGGFLLAFRGRLFFGSVESMKLLEIREYMAIGSGSEVALGSFASTVEDDPEKRVKTALAAARKHARGVRGPMVQEFFPAAVLSQGASE